jgi:hypothetical protein
MMIRSLSGIVAGLIVGVVIYEALLAGAGILVSDFGLSGPLAGEPVTGASGVIALALIHALAAGLASAMATAIAGRHIGAICGMAWLVPVFLLGSVSAMSQLLWGGLAIACLIGALLGSRLAMLAERP